MRTEKKHKLKQLRQWRIRKTVSGTAARPRMAVCFSNENIHVQFIDDVAGKTIAAASTVSKGEAKELSANVDGAKKIGVIAAKNALEKGITIVVVVDAKAGRDRFVGIPVVASLDAVPGGFDALVITDLTSTRDTVKAALTALEAERIFVPALLGLRPDRAMESVA